MLCEPPELDHQLLQLVNFVKLVGLLMTSQPANRGAHTYPLARMQPACTRFTPHTAWNCVNLPAMCLGP